MAYMSIEHLSGPRITSSQVTSSTQILRPGQIVQGKIIKLFPDNKAQIQLGSGKMIAQLEASLAVGGKYHFQVQASFDVVHLKVIGEQLKNQANINMMNLMQQLGLKATKSSVALMQALISEKIPFSKEQIQKALQLLNGAKNKSQAQSIIKEMIAARLPITDSVLQALTAKNTNGMTNQMKSLLQQLRQDPNPTQLDHRLSDRLSQMTERPTNTLVKQIQNQAASNNQQLFNLVKATGDLNTSVDFARWKSEWAAFSKQNNTGNNSMLPFGLNSTKMMSSLEQINTNKVTVREETQTILQKWSTVFETAAANNSRLPSQEFTQLKQQLISSLQPLLSSEQQQKFTKLLQNNPTQLHQLFTTLQTLANSQTYSDIEQFLTTVKIGETFLSSSPKEQFLSQIQQVLRFTGLNYENQLAIDMAQEQSRTVKSMLLQMLQQSDGAIKDQSHQLLNLINGLQIQSVNETADFLQATLQIPGEKLGLPGDMQLDFEGKKTEEDKVNPDFCRIIFYLELDHLKETIIDMNIQKRAVAMTIFNDQTEVADYSTSLKPMLKDGLDSLDYQLTTIAVKPIHENNQSNQDKLKTTYQNSYQGVDYRV